VIDPASATCRQRRALLAHSAAALAAVAALLAGGCGHGEGAVARVNGVSIEAATLDRWATSAALTPGSSQVPPFARCFAALRLAILSAGQAPASTRTPESPPNTCPSDRRKTSRRARALEFLIVSTWLSTTAAELADPKVRSTIDRRGVAGQRGQGDPTSALALDGRMFARVVGDLRARADAQAHGELADYYRQNIQQFVLPETRDAEVVRTRTLRAGREARAAIESGTAFAAAARRFSVDPARANGGLVPGLQRRREDSVLAPAVFSARLHVLTGPVRLEPGRYYLFRIRSVKPPKNMTLAEVEARRLDGFRRSALSRIGEEWTDRLSITVECQADHLVEGCGPVAL